jgi:hypothetical protein
VSTVTGAAPVHALKLAELAVAPGGPETATGYGCPAHAPVVLMLGTTTIDRTAANGQGTFAVPITTSTLPVGHYTVSAHCGIRLAAAFDVVTVARMGQDGATVVIIIFFILLGLLVFRRVTRAEGREPR